jgi:DNA-binding CsgD family transcriptional regulator
MEFGKNNELWITHAYKGAFKIDLIQDKISSIHFYNQTKGFPSNNLINVFSLRNDLTFSSEKGIYNYHPDQDFFKPDTFFTNQFKSDEQLWVMKEDLFGNIYFIGKDKVGVLKRNSLGEYSMETNSFNRIAHSLNDDLENLHVLPTNEVLFGSKDGFIHYSPKKANGKKSNFQTLIRRVSTTQDQRDSILSFGNYVEYEKMVGLQPSTMKLKLPYANNSIEFQFSATSYEGTEVHYQYWLENFEKKWSEWNVSTQKEFTNLKEGRYIFHVRARNFEGVISTEATFIFSILAPWYRSLWAMAAYVLLIIAALVGAFFAIDRKYQREQRMMDLKQKKAMIRKQNEIEKMTQQSQDEINRLQNEKLESELMHIHKQLGMSTFHLLNKNEFMSVLKSNLNNIIKKETALASKKELTGIVKNIEENILADTDWKQFQMHFDKVHGDFCRNFKIKHPELSPQEIKLGAYLKMNLSTKEIAQLLHISVRGVEISRYRLRKKLHLERSVNLQDYILGFN